MEPLYPKRDPPRRDESVFSFVSRRFGKTIAERLADPFIAGVFGGDAHAMEVASAFPAWVGFEQGSGSVLMGALRSPRKSKPATAPKTLWTFRDGIETLPRALSTSLGDRLRLRAPVSRVEPHGAGLRVRTDGGAIDAARVVVCVPGVSAASFLPSLAPELTAIASGHVAAVHLAWPESAVERRTRGFGWLAPSSQRLDVLGCLYVSDSFPGHAPGQILMRVMIGGTRSPRLAAVGSGALVAHARQIVADIEGIQAEPSFTHVSVHPTGIPQYHRGHGERMDRLAHAVPGVSFLGWGYTGVGVEHGVRAALGWSTEPAPPTA
jgi:oxygen-dependent protoporphyrinogen oxidase